MLRWGLVIGLIMALSACGPEQSTLDQQRQLMNIDSKNQKAQLDSIAGDYCGSMSLNNSTVVKVILRLRGFSILAVDTGQNQIIEIPSLLGVMTDLDNNEITWEFNQGSYDKDNSTLTVIGASTPGTSGGIAPSATTYMKLRRIGSKFTGEFMAGRNYSSDVNLTKGTNCK